MFVRRKGMFSIGRVFLLFFFLGVFYGGSGVVFLGFFRVMGRS